MLAAGIWYVDIIFEYSKTVGEKERRHPWNYTRLLWNGDHGWLASWLGGHYYLHIHRSRCKDRMFVRGTFELNQLWISTSAMGMRMWLCVTLLMNMELSDVTLFVFADKLLFHLFVLSNPADNVDNDISIIRSDFWIVTFGPKTGLIRQTLAEHV